MKAKSSILIMLSLFCIAGCGNNNNSSVTSSSTSSENSSISSSSEVAPITLSLTYEKTDSGYIVTGETSGVENIVIPSEYNGLPVTEIGESAFSYTKHTAKITSIVIPDSITIIHDNAFYDRTDLISVTISENSELTTIENNAFTNNSALKEIYLPKKLSRLGDEGEYSYPYSVFNDCGSLETITIASENETYTSEGNAIIEKATGKLIRGTNNTIIPSIVTTIGERSFTNLNQMTELTIPTSVKTIENYIISWSETSINTIRYLGTEEEWQNVVKASSWDNDNSNYTLVFGTKEVVKALVIYFSATNNTEKVASYIANYINAPLYELEPVEAYTSADLNWTNNNSRVVKEHNDQNRHVELKNVKFTDFESAQYIFLGAPVWWQELSWVVDDFVKLNDFSNKTIIPFATSSSSGFTTTKLQSYTNNATWLSPQRFSSSVSESSVTSWIDKLNLSL